MKHCRPLNSAEAGRALAKVGDPRPEVMSVEAMQFCHVPAGEFKMGEGKEQHTISLPEFWMSQYPVTNIQFDQFVKAGGYGEGSFWQEAQQENFWKDGKFKGRYDNAFRGGPINYGDPFNYNNHPVVGVSWYEALAFTRWLEEQIRKQGQLKVWGEKILCFGKRICISVCRAKPSGKKRRAARMDGNIRGEMNSVQPKPTWKIAVLERPVRWDVLQVAPVLMDYRI